jgi:hypothetical protein
MNHSFYSADRTTHLKIVVIALAAGTALAGVAISSRVNASSETAGVNRAAQPAAMTSSTLTQMRG